MAEAVAANVSSRRNVTIEVTNLTNRYCLINPRVYLEKGGVHIPPTPTVRPMKIEMCNFTKSSAKASGAVGVLTYELYEKKKKGSQCVAIMFSVPYDYNLYKNWFAVGIYDKEKECNEDLYKEMYYNKETGFVRAEAKGNGITFEGDDLDIKANMSPLGRAIIKVEIWEKLFSPSKSQHC